MQAAKEYISQSRKAVEQLIDSINYYDKILNEGVIVSPFFADHGTDEPYLNWLSENQDLINKAKEKLKSYVGSDFSREALSGALLQIVYQGIKLYQEPVKSEIIPREIKEGLNNNINDIKKCWFGRIETDWEFPIGAIVYATRNQFNHFEEAKLKNKFTSFVIERISNKDSSIKHRLKEKKSVGYYVIQKLEWYDIYQFDKDFKELLGVTS